MLRPFRCSIVCFLIALAAPAAARQASLSIRDARFAAESLPPAERALQKTLLMRPTDPGSQFAFTVPEATPHCTDNFCIHYVTTTSDAPQLGDVDDDGVPDDVEKTAELLEAARAGLLALGYSYHGVTDEGLGGDDRMDAYIKDVGFQFTAAVVPEDFKSFAPIRLSSYIVINTTAYTLPEDYFKGTISHELKHTFDAATFGNAPAWLFESSAVWIENELDDADTAHTVFFPCWFSFPDFPLDPPRDQLYPPGAPGNCGAAPYHIYGSATFWFHLGAELGSDVNRKIWDQGGLACVSGSEPDSPENRRCVADTLAQITKNDHGLELPELFLAFSRQNYRPQKSATLLKVESGGELFAWPDGPSIETRHASYPAEGSGTLDHWASRYFEFDPLSSGARTLEVSVDGPDGEAFGAALVVTQGSDLLEVPIELDPSDNTGSASVEAFGATASRVALVVTNPAPVSVFGESDGRAFSYAATLSGGSAGAGGTGGVAGAAGAAGASGSAGSPAAPAAEGDDGGCGCRTPRTGSVAGLPMLLGLIALAACRLRARDRRTA